MVDFTPGHVGLNVSDLAASKAFYQEVLDLTVGYESKEEGREFALLSNKAGLMLTLWQQSSGTFSANQPGLHHLALKAESLEIVQAIETKLLEKKVNIFYDGIVSHGEGDRTAAIFFEDPDGIRLEVYTGSGGEAYRAPHGEAPSCGFF